MADEVVGFNRVDADALLRSLGKSTGDRRLRSFPVASPMRFFKAPSGGISARSGATLGSATCTVVTVMDGTRAEQSESQTVYNYSTTEVGANANIIAAFIDGIWVAIYEDCT